MAGTGARLPDRRADLGGYDRPFDHATKLADGARGLLPPEAVDGIVARLRDETGNPLASEISTLINGAMKENRLGMLLLSPALLVLTALVIVPLLATIAFSFFDLRLGESSAKFIGLRELRRSAGQRAVLAIAQDHFPVDRAVGHSTAGAGHHHRGAARSRHPVQAFLRGAIFLPWVIPVAVVAYMWQWLLTPETGLVSGIAGGAGLEGLARFPSCPRPTRHSRRRLS